MPEVTEEDILARFILHRNRYSPTKGIVKLHAFMPDPKGELSVFVISNWLDEIIWQVGQDYVAGPQGKSLKARGDLVVSVVLKNRLTVDMDNNPVGHANVMGWPDSDHKDEQKIIAIELAKASRLLINPVLAK